MRSTNFLASFLLALLSFFLQLTLAEPIPPDNLVELGSGLDIAPTSVDSQQPFTSGITLSKSNSEKGVCPAGY
ncbi:hypothetical protein FRC10_010949, partial [Ceratobasidium sp. 414]